MDAQPQLRRRALLSGAVAGLALPWVPRGIAAPPPRPVSEAAWDKLAALLKGGVIRPNDPRFRALTRPENLRYYNPPFTPDAPPDPDAPLGAVMPRDAGEVATAIAWARDVGLPMVPRSGGHSYTGGCTIDGLVIHARAMRRARQVSDGLIDVEGGALNTDVFTALREAKGRDAPDGLTITHGRCGAVGLSAFLLGGGIGFGMRDHGLGCDLVESVELVLADGRIVTASATNEPDLFWAARGGGGGNLGFATRWRLRAEPAEPLVAFYATWKWKSRGNEEAVYARLVRALEAAPDRLGAKLTIVATKAWSNEPSAISLMGQLRGSADEFRSLFGPSLAETNSVAIVPLSYWDAQMFLGEEAVPNRYQEVSRYAGKLPDGFIGDVFRWCRNWPGTQAGAILTLFLAGGRISSIPAEATAFVHRPAQWLMASDLGWAAGDSPADVQRNLDWQRALLDGLATHMGDGGSYQNFPDPGLADPAKAYWGTNLPRLSDIKRRIDPTGVFTPPRRQGIAG